MADETRQVCYGYARVSTEEQSRDGVSLVAQEAAIRAYATARGLALDRVLTTPG